MEAAQAGQSVIQGEVRHSASPPSTNQPSPSSNELDEKLRDGSNSPKSATLSPAGSAAEPASTNSFDWQEWQDRVNNEPPPKKWYHFWRRETNLPF